MQLLERLEGFPTPGRGDGWILKTAYFLENYIGTCNWQCRYMRGRWSKVCCIKRGRKAPLKLLVLYQRMRNATAEVSHKPTAS